MNFIISIFKGVAIGAGAILPGISSGVLCVIFGIYEKLVNSVLYIFKDFKKNFLFLLPIVIGCFLGVLLFSNILKHLFNTYNTQICFLFIGLILGSIPSLFKQANEKKGFRLHFLIYTLVSFFIGLFMFLFEKSNSLAVSRESISPIYLTLSGAVMSIGVIIPGMSSTVLLMCMGTYYTYLNAISSFDLYILIPMGIGLVVGSIICLFAIKILMDKFYTQTFYSIIGFVLGSILVLLPSGTIDILCILLFLLGFMIALKFEKLKT